MSGEIIGIDLGTTNSCCAIVEDDGNVKIIPYRGGETTIPSIFAIDDKGNELVGYEAKRQWLLNPKRTIYGAKRHQAKTDELLRQYVEHWDLERMAVVDRNILRLAIYEMVWSGDVPSKVAINEAIEIAKKFGTSESSRFINGVLDRIHRELRPAS